MRVLCGCENVSEETVRLLIVEGCRTIEEIGEACGAGTGCSSCHYDIEDLILAQEDLESQGE